ncbi:hypothetical protein TorRG33x02_144190, partial [Trema orientale]
ETLHFHTETVGENEGTFNSFDANKYGSNLSATLQESEKMSNFSTKSSKELAANIIYYIVNCVFQLRDMAYAEIFPLWAASHKKYGGLDYSSADIGKVLTISGT